MAARIKPQPLRTKGGAWGQERVRLGLSLKELSRRTGINSGTLSHLESGRMNPTGAEFERVMAVLRDAEALQSEGTTAEGSTPKP